MDFTLLKTLVIRWQNEENERFHGRHVVYDMINRTAAFNTSFFFNQKQARLYQAYGIFENISEKAVVDM